MAAVADRRAVAAPPAVDEPTWVVWARYWLVVGIWMAIISYLSTDAFSAANTNRYIDPLLRFLFPDITVPEVVIDHTIIRKMAHFSEFLVLSLLAFWAFRAGRSPRWSRPWMLKALLLAAVYALIDEGHQIFTVSRTPSPLDSGVDILGAATGQLLIAVRHVLRTVGPAG